MGKRTLKLFSWKPIDLFLPVVLAVRECHRVVSRLLKYFFQKLKIASISSFFFFWALASNMTHHLFICGVFSLKQKVSGSLISVEELISDNWSSKSLITRPYSPKKKLNRQIYLGFLYLQQLVFFLIFQIPNSACNSYHPNIVLLCCKEKATEQLKILQFSKLFQVKRLEKFLKEKLWSKSLKQRTSNICLLAILHWENCGPRCWKVIGCKEKERIPPGICHQSLKEMKKI